MLEDLVSLKMLTKPGKPACVLQWKRLEDGWVKVNSHAAFDSNTCTDSARVVIRDHSGLVRSMAA